MRNVFATLHMPPSFLYFKYYHVSFLPKKTKYGLLLLPGNA